jgi:hypothetical protein
VSAVPVAGGFGVGSLITDIVMKKFNSPVSVVGRVEAHKKPARIDFPGSQHLIICLKFDSITKGLNSLEVISRPVDTTADDKIFYCL